MRFFIVSNELPPQTGMVVGRPDESRVEAVVREYLQKAERTPDQLAKNLKARLGAQLLLGPVVGPVVSDIYVHTQSATGPGQQNAMHAIEAAYRLGLADQRSANTHASTVGGALISDDPSVLPRHALPFERRCITLMLVDGTRVSVPANLGLFCGAFASDAQLKAILAEDGGTSRIHLFNRGVARSVFKRHGGGILEDGVYLLHPKRDDVLVPFRTFHTDMLQEMTREVRVVMGRIGAKKLVVETVEGVTFSGSVVSRIPLKAGKGEFEAKEKAERSMTYEWGSPTFEPERALEDCVWIRDNAGAMTIVDQRRTSDLIHFEEYSKLDTSFRVGLDVMKVFEANFAWASTSTYRYAVDFFPRR